MSCMCEYINFLLLLNWCNPWQRQMSVSHWNLMYQLTYVLHTQIYYVNCWWDNQMENSRSRSAYKCHRCTPVPHEMRLSAPFVVLPFTRSSKEANSNGLTKHYIKDKHNLDNSPKWNRILWRIILSKQQRTQAPQETTGSCKVLTL